MAKRLILTGLVALVLALAWILWQAGRARVRELPAEVRSSLAIAEGRQSAVELFTSTGDLSGAGRKATARQEPTSAVPRATDEDMASEEAEAILRIHVLAKETAEPLGGIRLCVSPRESWSGFLVDRSQGRPNEGIVTDENGRAEFVVHAYQRYHLQVNTFQESKAQSRELVVPPMRAGEKRELQVDLLTLDDLVWYGRVVDGETGAPLASATYAIVEGNPFEVGPGGTPVDADGNMKLAAASWIYRVVRIDCAEYWIAVVAAGPGHTEALNAQEVKLWHAAMLDLRVDDGRAVPFEPALQARTSADSSELLAAEGQTWFGKVWQNPVWSASADLEGLFHFASLPPRVPLRVEVLGGETLLRRESITLAPGERRELVVTLVTGCTIAGRAIDPADGPVAGLEVWLMSAAESSGRYFESYQRHKIFARTQTDADGAFTFQKVEPGLWLIGPAAYREWGAVPLGKRARESIAPLAVELSIQQGDSFLPVTLTCWRGLYISGRVLDSSGTPSGEAFVNANAMSERLSCTTGVLEGGRFVLGPLAPGEYELRAQGFDVAGASSEPVRARAGDEGVELYLRWGGSLSVTVRSEHGDPLSNVEVELVPAHGKAEEWTMTSTDDNGHVEFKGVLPGSYALFASQGSEVGVLYDVAIGNGSRVEGIELVLRPGVRIAVHVSIGDPSSIGIQVVSNGWGRLLQLDSSGDGSLVVLPGELEVQLIGWRGETGLQVLEIRRVRADVSGEIRVEFLRMAEAR